MAELVGAPCSDGSSTESEYYFDPMEDMDEKKPAGGTLAQEHHCASIQQEPLNESERCHNDENNNGSCNMDQSECKELKEMILPQGSEWSHGRISTVSENAVERALAMARELKKATKEQNELSTTNAVGSNTSLVDDEEKKETSMHTHKRERMETELEDTSRKKVKTTLSPVSVKKQLDVGVKDNIMNGVEKSSKLDMVLAVAHSPRKLIGRDAFTTTKESENGTTLLPQNQSQHETVKRETVASSWKGEHNNSEVYREKDHSTSQTIRQTNGKKILKSLACTEQDTVLSTCRANRRNSPASSFAEQDGRTKRVTSSVVHYLRKKTSATSYVKNGPVAHCAGRSRSRSLSRRLERRPRLRSRSLCRAMTTNPQSHPCRVGKNVPSWQHDKKRPRNSYKHIRSYSRSPRSVHATQAGSENQDRQETRSRYSYNDSHELPHERRGETVNFRRFSSHQMSARIGHGAHESNRETFRLRSMDYHRSRSEHDRIKLNSPQRDDFKSGKRHDERAETPMIKRRISHDYFKGQVFKLKLKEADVDEMIASRSEADSWLCESRKQTCNETRAQLVAQNPERFERVYASTIVTQFALKRYQKDRDFGWRVVQFERKQTSLQEKNDLFISMKTKANLWRELAKERESLIAENSVLFHKVMMSQLSLRKRREAKAANVDIAQNLRKY